MPAAKRVRVMRNNRKRVKAAESLRSLARHVRGTVAVYVAITAPVLLGIGALALDLGRVMTVNTHLQSAADAAAMAGAASLDRFAGSRDRARATAKDAVTNFQTFAAGPAEVSIDTSDCADPPVAPCIRFLKDLPASDADPITAANLAATDEEARFIDVHIGARTVTNVLIRLVGGPATAATSATAVAGNDQVICNIPPMWMCNPTEPPGNTDPNWPVDIEALEGRQMQLFHQGGGGQYLPGNFGLLCPVGTEEKEPCGAGYIRDALASTTGTCVGVGLVTTKTGVDLQMVRTGINARHDYFTPQARTDDHVPWRQQDAFTPAANVTQGGKPKAGGGNSTKCEYDEISPVELNADGLTLTQWIALDPVNNTAGNFVVDHTEYPALGLPRDQCHLNDNCEVVDGNIDGNNRVGDGNWDYKEYFRINHACDQSTNPTCEPSDWDAVTGGADWPPTRYETYRYEIEMVPEVIVNPGQDIYDASGTMMSYKTEENGRTECFQATPPEIPGYDYYPDKVRDLSLLGDRRVMPIVVGNCYALGSPTGKFSFKPSEFLFVFLTEPMKNPSDSEIYAEILGKVDDDAKASLIRDIVQLYRRGG